VETLLQEYCREGVQQHDVIVAKVGLCEIKNFRDGEDSGGVGTLEEAGLLRGAVADCLVGVLAGRGSRVQEESVVNSEM
jgi:hypothetical protein